MHEIDPTLAPGMYMFGKAPQAHRELVAAQSDFLYAAIEDPSHLAKDVPALTGAASDRLARAVRHFTRSAGQGMQYEMDRLNGVVRHPALPECARK